LMSHRRSVTGPQYGRALLWSPCADKDVGDVLLHGGW
jgi:hypothetical protein